VNKQLFLVHYWLSSCMYWFLRGFSVICLIKSGWLFVCFIYFAFCFSVIVFKCHVFLYKAFYWTVLLCYWSFYCSYLLLLNWVIWHFFFKCVVTYHFKVLWAWCASQYRVWCQIDRVNVIVHFMLNQSHRTLSASSKLRTWKRLFCYVTFYFRWALNIFPCRLYCYYTFFLLLFWEH